MPARPAKQLGSIGGSPPAVALPATPAVSFRNSKFQPAARSRCTATALDSFCAIGADAFALGVAGVEHESPPYRPALLAMQYAFRQYRRSDGVRLGSIKLRARFIGSINNP
jgi:hypothetical protein